MKGDMSLYISYIRDNIYDRQCLYFTLSTNHSNNRDERVRE